MAKRLHRTTSPYQTRSLRKGCTTQPIMYHHRKQTYKPHSLLPTTPLLWSLDRRVQKTPNSHLLCQLLTQRFSTPSLTRPVKPKTVGTRPYQIRSAQLLQMGTMNLLTCLMPALRSSPKYPAQLQHTMRLQTLVTILCLRPLVQLQKEATKLLTFLTPKQPQHCRCIHKLTQTQH